MDEDYTVATLSQWVTQGKVDFFLHVGDLSYADDWVVDDQYESVTEQWMNKQQGIWTEKPYMILPGTPHNIAPHTLPPHLPSHPVPRPLTDCDSACACSLGV